MHVETLSRRSLFTGDGSASEATVRSLTDPDRPLARFERPRSPDPVTLAVISDPHVSVDAQGTWKLYHRTRARFRETLADLERRGVDGLLLAGDLTKDGDERDLDWVRSALEGVDVPVLAVPGNHDLKEVGISDFEARFSDGEFPVHARIAGVDVLGLNTAKRTGAVEPDQGTVSDEQLEWLRQTLPATEDPIVVTHHNLPGLADHIGREGWTPHPPVENATAFLETLARHDVPLHLSGHVHLLSLVRTGGVRGLIAPALSSFPQSYLLLEIDAAGTTVRCRTAANGAEIDEAYAESQRHSDRSTVISELNAEQFRTLPLVDERTDTTEDIRPIRRPGTGTAG